MILSGTYFPFLSPTPSEGKVPEILIRIAPQRIHDLISMCHADLIGSGTTSRDLRALKMFLFDSVCFRRDNEAPLVERVKAL